MENKSPNETIVDRIDQSRKSELTKSYKSDKIDSSERIGSEVKLKSIPDLQLDKVKTFFQVDEKKRYE